VAQAATHEVAPVTNQIDIAERQEALEAMTAQQRVAWGLEQFQDRIVLASSFGAQSALMLHMVTQEWPEIPVVLVDTGYLFPETYQFIDQLTERLKLNLQVYRNPISPAWQEARYGRLWEQGLEGIEFYNQINKIEPMRRALDELSADAWFAGLRRQQARSRQDTNVFTVQNERYKIHPVIDWTDRDVFYYLKEYDLPYHPLWHEGYVSIGDWHTTKRLDEVDDEEETRFYGLKRECGLHEKV
jgi:phosphoadenosine phosphosulfate reductase